MRRVHGEAVPMTCEEAASYQSLKAEYDALEAEHAEADELPDDIDARLGEIEEVMEALEARPIRYDAEDLALAGAFVSIDSSGRLRVERAYVRAEDEPSRKWKMWGGRIRTRFRSRIVDGRPQRSAPDLRRETKA